MLKYIRNKVRVYVFIDSRRSSLIVRVWPLRLDFVITVLSNIQVLEKLMWAKNAYGFFEKRDIKVSLKSDVPN